MNLYLFLLRHDSVIIQVTNYRKGCDLGLKDILHYQKIIVALMGTDRLMKEIDKVKFVNF
ncbi:hypothetical protein GCM10027284_09590 [Cyclobacterium sediminis]